MWVEWLIEGERWSKVHAINLSSPHYTRCGKIFPKEGVRYDVPPDTSRNIQHAVCRKCKALEGIT